MGWEVRRKEVLVLSKPRRHKVQSEPGSQTWLWDSSLPLGASFASIS